LRIIYQLNNSISSIPIIFSFSRRFWDHTSHLRKLENLDLSYIIFNDSILSYLRGFSYLKSLNLSGDMLLGSTTVNDKVVKSLDFFRQFIRRFPRAEEGGGERERELKWEEVRNVGSKWTELCVTYSFLDSLTN